MNEHFSERIKQVPPSFLRKIFDIIENDDIISFAAGLPNPALFPVEAFKKAALTTLEESPETALQYGTTSGIPELRSIIAESYKKKDGIDISPDQVLITNGSQQGLDLLGKVLINKGDVIATENPTYLAAIQAFSMYEPQFVGIHLGINGMDITNLEKVLEEHNPKIVYTIPNFQNPTGITYSDDVRSQIANIVSKKDILLIEDDPYGEIRFEGTRCKPFAAHTEEAILLGSFSKIIAPGLRLGWIIARDKELYNELTIAKQATDLHTSTFTQHVVYRYYRDNDTQAHVNTIAVQYKNQKDAMITALEKHLGDSVSYTNPEGGMFIWATCKEKIDTAKLFPLAIKEGVAFVPGESFFASNAAKNTMRLNFTNSTPEQIDEGMQRLARALKLYSK